VKGILSFLGMQTFIEDLYKTFPRLLDPHSFLAKDASFIFKEECLQAFHTLKKALISAPNIQPPD
jgi:hypothetical protein